MRGSTTLYVEKMMRSRDNDASVEKVVDRVVEIEGQFDGQNITRHEHRLEFKP